MYSSDEGSRMNFDVNRFKSQLVKTNRYERRLNRLKDEGFNTENIESTVREAVENIYKTRSRSFVIYGEPQSGKTELMIALTGALLDNGARIVVILLNDNLQLLSQNLERFKRSGIDPSPRNFSEILDPSVDIRKGEWIIFCKKNPKDLMRFLEKLGRTDGLVVIDDEADYASPNSKINKREKTKINELIEKLIKKDGIYIGVTATPARLDLNNTFNNQKEGWVMFRPHPDYKGQVSFFPLDVASIRNREFRLNLLPDTMDSPRYLREALFRFFLNVAYLNKQVNKKEDNYSILVHTSGKRADHTQDYQVVVKTLAVLSDHEEKDFEPFVKKLWDLAQEEHRDMADDLVDYVLRNITRNTIVVMNSDIDKRVIDFQSATKPAALFTIAIGGNIVSRGVTFENLLSMYFTRDVKHKIQQDTYIQRARMFGTRGKYLKYFELTIPDYLYHDWHRCFIFHRLALESIRAGNGSPVWLEDNRISVVAPASIDKATVTMDKGEMAFEIFDYNEKAISNIVKNAKITSYDKMIELRNLLGDTKLPSYLVDYIKNFSPRGPDSLAIHPSRDMSGYGDADKDKIERTKGFIGQSDLEEAKYPLAVHHLKVFHNGRGQARVFYKYFGGIKFLKNLI